MRGGVSAVRDAGAGRFFAVDWRLVGGMAAVGRRSLWRRGGKSDDQS